MRTKNSHKEQLGQTLIETLVAVFILVTGIVSGLGLAISSYQASQNSSKQIIGTALARQAIEAVKNIRDSNWYADTKVDCEGYVGNGSQFCYQNWLTAAQSISAGTFAVDLNTQTNGWTLVQNPSVYTLNYDPVTGIYKYNGTGSASIYKRKVDISMDTSSPYNNNNPRVIVVSSVWWSDRKCPSTNNPATLPANCKVVLEMNLTNWRAY